MRYIDGLGELIGKHAARIPRSVLYGENLASGSRISGLTKQIKQPHGGLILNVGNSEHTHCGVGFGMMLNGVSSVLFVKQLDFMLLGMDHFVSTYSAIRARPPKDLGSFTVIGIVCDQGFQGPQSSLNALGDFCSLARVPGFCLTNRSDSELILSRELGAPGFRFIFLSQRLFPTELIEPGPVKAAGNGSILQYSEGADVTLVSFNFSFPDVYRLQGQLSERGLECSVFAVHYVPVCTWDLILRSVQRTGRLVVLDDSKSVHLSAYQLLDRVASVTPSSRRVLVKREEDIEFGPNPDALRVNLDEVVRDVELM